ncbi:DUF4238 domain-containing protein [Rhodanobacter glycinis]|uniref:DUF4238 domain-containing protein n=1 Tax=Rhodanobacter glycinis TaxID=582702 RepID=UPI001F4FF95E|nr:DUF4238 domain-containing protein [Rhodanobacter glycinis]
MACEIAGIDQWLIPCQAKRRLYSIMRLGCEALVRRWSNAKLEELMKTGGSESPFQGGGLEESELCPRFQLFEGISMAGRRQHYIPRFLQRGFLAHRQAKGEGERTWLHLRSQKAKLTGIRHVGVEEYFYSRPRKDGVPTLDDVITKVEEIFREDLAYVSGEATGVELDRGRVARLTAHLVLRTAFIRSAFSNAAEQVLDGVIAEVGTREGARSRYGIDDPTQDIGASALVVATVAALTDAGITMPPRLAERVAGYAFRERFDEFFADIEPQITLLQTEMARTLSSIVSDAHKKALAKADQEAWETALARLTWRAHEVDGAVLPDCIAIAQAAGNELTPLILAGLEGLETCIVPIRTDRVLIGTVHEALSVDVTLLNLASAACSDRFFIASKPMDESELAEHIGRRGANAILETVQDALTSLHRIPTTTAIPGTAPPRSRHASESSQFSYTLSAPAFEEPEQFAAFQEIVTVVVRELSRGMPLGSLDGITFASEYGTAIAELDRGDPTLVPDLSEPRSYGRPVAKCVDVVRNGMPKSHLILDAMLALDLISDSETDRSSALHMLVTMLGHVAHDVLYLRPLNESRPSFPNSLISLLHRATAPVPGHYFTARESAFADPSAGARYAELFRDSMAAARAEIEAARLDYRITQDMDALLEVAIGHVRHVMSHAAQWCGHNDGCIDGSDAHDQSMIDVVTSLDLDHWLDLLGNDLRQLYGPSDDFSINRIFALTRHVERLLWTFQIFPWLMDDGRTYVTLPMGNDEAL